MTTRIRNLDFGSRPNARFRSAGLHADRPAALGTGDTYISTDYNGTGALNVAIGTTWTIIPFAPVLTLANLSDVDNSVTFTKGNLIVGNGTSFINLPAPANERLYVADSTQSAGYVARDYKVSGLYDVDTAGIVEDSVPAWSVAGSKWVMRSRGGSDTTFAGFRIKKSSNTVVAQSAETSVAFDQEDYDTSSYHDNVTNNSRALVGAGKWLIGFYAKFTQASGSNGYAEMYVRLNGTTDIFHLRHVYWSGDTSNMWLSGVFEYAFSTSDYIELQLVNSLVSAVNLTWYSAELRLWGEYRGA